MQYSQKEIKRLGVMMLEFSKFNILFGSFLVING